MKQLTPDEQESVKGGILLALRKADALEAMYAKRLPGWAETPSRRTGHPSVFKLPRYVVLISQDGVTVKKLAQCSLGARTEKMTDILSFGMALDFIDICSNTHQSGGACRGTVRGIGDHHPPFAWQTVDGACRRVALWHVNHIPPRGHYITRGAAAYPAGMNQVIAEPWVRGGCCCTPVTATDI